ncbi:MAG: YncE family protein [Ornithinimicrobium sp.]
MDSTKGLTLMPLSSEPVQRWRWRAAGVALVTILAVAVTACLPQSSDPSGLDGRPSLAQDGEATAGPTGESAGQDSQDGQDSQARRATPPPTPSERTRMEPIDYITGDITPKSVVASGAGLVIANNMMYSHTSTVYDSTTHELLATVDDSVDLADFDLPGHAGTSKGAPVEAAWTDDGRYAYVSQYTMYGEGFGKAGFDACTPADGVGSSLLYRFDAAQLAWDQVIAVGAVPKFVAITPDQTRVLVSNWCDSTLSVVDRDTAREVATIPIAAAPRGIEILPDNRTAYVAAMYADTLFTVDLVTGRSEVMMETGAKPRHLNLSEDGAYLYMAVSGADTIYKIDTATEQIVDQVVSGREPRSMSLSADGTALYVVNYYEPSVAKISTDDMTLMQKEPTDANPIGVTYDPVTHQVWVACYGGSIYVFDDQAAAL